MPDWIWVCAAFTGLAVLIWFRKTCYEQGIWDGAFNRSLPHVQRAMVDYRPQEALDMLAREQIPIQQSVLEYAAIDHGAFLRCPHDDSYDDCPDCRH